MTYDIAATLTAAAASATSPLSMIAVLHFRGAAARVPAEDTAFTLRRDHLLIEIVAAWQPSHGAGDTHRGLGRWLVHTGSPPAHYPAATLTCSYLPNPSAPCSPTGPTRLGCWPHAFLISRSSGSRSSSPKVMKPRHREDIGHGSSYTRQLALSSESPAI